MSTVGQREIQTQRRVVTFFQNALGYRYLGHWQDRPDNRNVERELVANWLKRQGHSDKIIDKALLELNKAAGLGGSKTLYDANREVYGLLRYGVKVRPDVGEQNVTVWLIDWKNPGNNDFGIAEEVTVRGDNTKRPDLVLYVNGIALGVLELKRSTVSVTEGIRQNLDSQKKEFIEPFFSTVQLVMAGNETEGLRYGVIETSEKYWLHWKEAEAHPSADDNPLLRELSQLCGKERLLEIIHDFVVFDAGVKKTAAGGHDDWLHRDAVAQERQATEYRNLRAVHPRLQVLRGGERRRGAGLALRGARHRPEHHLAGQDRSVVRHQDPWADGCGQGSAQAALGHAAKSLECAGPAGENRRRHPVRHGDARPPQERPRQRHARLRQHLFSLPLLRPISSQVKKADWWGNRLKEREIRNAIHAELGGNESLVNAIFEIVKAQSEY